MKLKIKNEEALYKLIDYIMGEKADFDETHHIPAYQVKQILEKVKEKWNVKYKDPLFPIGTEVKVLPNLAQYVNSLGWFPGMKDLIGQTSEIVKCDKNDNVKLKGIIYLIPIDCLEIIE